MKTAVRLSPEAPGQGSYCLELQVINESPGGTPPAIPQSPVWVTSPPLQTPPGHLVEISGQVRVAEAPLGLADPLVIFDSIGGEEGAIRVDSSPAWRPFRMVARADAWGGAATDHRAGRGGAGRRWMGLRCVTFRCDRRRWRKRRSKSHWLCRWTNHHRQPDLEGVHRRSRWLLYRTLRTVRVVAHGSP